MVQSVRSTCATIPPGSKLTLMCVRDGSQVPTLLTRHLTPSIGPVLLLPAAATELLYPLASCRRASSGVRRARGDGALTTLRWILHSWTSGPDCDGGGCDGVGVGQMGEGRAMAVGCASYKVPRSPQLSRTSHSYRIKVGRNHFYDGGVAWGPPTCARDGRRAIIPRRRWCEKGI